MYEIRRILSFVWLHRLVYRRLASLLSFFRGKSGQKFAPLSPRSSAQGCVYGVAVVAAIHHHISRTNLVGKRGGGD